jgi:dolichyl-phosphate-mannose-protein mannosyltransferase
LQDEAPEPIKNVFDPPAIAVEEATAALLGPEPNVPMLESTESHPLPAVETSAIAQPNEDTRAPVGMDAGAPQVTAAEQDAGGWQGDAEDDGKRVAGEEALLPGEAKAETAPLGARVEHVPELELDDEARRLVEEAMKAQEGERLLL